MKTFTVIASASLILAGSVAYAEATIGPNENANAQGSNVGVFSSQVTGNGVVVSGQAKNGDRASEVQGILADEGRGRDKEK